jgi:hypothetical protein
MSDYWPLIWFVAGVFTYIEVAILAPIKGLPPYAQAVLLLSILLFWPVFLAIVIKRWVFGPLQEGER